MPSVTLPLNRTLVPAQGVQVAFDPAAAGDWPDAVIPSGLPDPSTKPTSATLTLTAARPFTLAESVGMQFVDEPSGAVESSGSWGGAAGGLDPEPGIDYWRATNWDTSTGVYGWYNVYGTGSGINLLDCGSHSDHWHGTTGTFDVTFRISREDWLKPGDPAYAKVVMYGPGFRVYFNGNPAPDSRLNFQMIGHATITATQAALGAVNDVPIWIRCSRNGSTLTIQRSADGSTWTTVTTSTFFGTVIDPGDRRVVVGGLDGTVFNDRHSVDGTLTDCTLTCNGTVVADIAMIDVPNTSAVSWTATSTGKTVDRRGGDLLGGAVGTIEPRFTFSTPSALSDFVLTMPGLRSGEVLVEQIVLELERHRRGLGLIR